MKLKSCLVACLAMFGLTSELVAQVPSTLNYQGRVAVNGVNFTGTGQFKFALVNAAGSQSYWSNDGSSSGGGQPTTAVSISVSSGLYSVQLGDTSLTHMTAVPATVFANGDVRLRVWFNDGTNGFQQMTPDQKIAAVGYAMMAATVPDGSITAAKLAPGVGGGGGGGSIADGSITAAKLASGAAAGNLAAGNLSAVASGGIIGSTDANNAALLAQGFVRDPAVIQSEGTWIPIPSGDTVAGHTAVWTGNELLIWGGVTPTTSAGMASYAAINRGVRYNPSTGAWAPISLAGAPQARFGHSAVWTGTEMIIWGGQTTNTTSAPATVLATGGKYNPTTNTWSSMSSNIDSSGPPPGIPDARTGHLAFWTGTEMLIWGGSSSSQSFGSSTGGGAVPLPGKRYNLGSNTWSSMAATNMELSAPISYSGVWTGSEMIIFAGNMGTAEPPRAGRYSPTVDAWQALPALPGNPAIESGFSTVWSGTEMIVWGGVSGAGTSYLNTGFKFNPAGASGLGTWTATTTTNTPTGRSGQYAVWSGTEMIVWGGSAFVPVPTPSFVQYNDGGRYNPATNAWQALSTADVPPARTAATVTMAGSKMIIWAGIQKDPGLPDASVAKYLKHGSEYQPSSNTWSPLMNGSPAPRFGHTAVWTGTDLIVWGGTVTTTGATGYDPTFGDGARFNAATGAWTPLPSLNAPTGRFNHTAVWTGTEMIVWGGQQFDTSGGPGMAVTLNSGARYNPLTDTWTTTSLAFPPSARTKHTAVWAGSPVNRMIVWGGTSDGVGMAVNTGGRYDPATNSWGTATSTTNAPTATFGHVSRWTGSEMIVFGGGLMNGYRYYPITNSWLSMAETPMALSAPPYMPPAAVWTGADLLAFVASNSAPGFGSYSPVSDLWQSPSTSGAPTGNHPSSYPTAVWTGTEMILWGVARDNPATFSTTLQGGRYSSVTDTWVALESTGAPSASYGASVWTGSEMLLWGGSPGDGAAGVTLSDKGHRYRLPQAYYLYRRP
ncbi:MAG: hypothetical protein IAE77_12735 [Prosthecobacter sp.]|uniref:Kelch repeat-containing protein n=1 Tax=Prosthecobacter sp. TaxID=1965333 RepID=UPI0019E42579|nr:hypothetical protein [Prosthecobacter sp.]MBE2284315.1 hypothetical protein [Prosthecobacter sp.]